jgi:peptide/nickel transport system substrate-binding protein
MKAPAPRYFFNFFTWKGNAGAFPIIPKHIFEGQDFATFQNYDLQKHWPITTGPFNVVASNAQQKIFDTRDDWWGSTSGLNHPLVFKRLVFLAAGTDQTVRSQMVVNGDIDITVLAPAAAISAIQQTPYVTFHSGRNPPYGYQDSYTQQLYAPTQTAPFNSADLRWAISYYLDRKQIVDVAWMGTTFPAPMPYPSYPALKKYTDSISDLLGKYNTNEYDPVKGDERMKAAGYTKNADGMWADSTGKQLKLSIEGWDEWDATGEIVVEQLRRAGIEATYSDPPDAYDRLARGEYDSLIADGAHAVFRDPYEALVGFTCSRIDASGIRVVGQNQTQWCNADFDKLVDQMALTEPNDEATLMPLYRKAMEIWLPDLPTVPMFEWMHNIAMVTKYWDCWPTVDGKFGEYVNEQPRVLGFGLVLHNLCRAGSN